MKLEENRKARRTWRIAMILVLLSLAMATIAAYLLGRWVSSQ